MAHFTARQYVSPSHGEAQQEREPELSVCVDEPEGIIKQESGAGFGCPREQLSPSSAATCVCGFLGSPTPVTRGLLGTGWAGDTSTASLPAGSAGPGHSRSLPTARLGVHADILAVK